MTENEAWGLYKKRRRKRMDERKRNYDEEEWKTIKGTHVMVDDDGTITKGPDNLKKLSKKKKTEQSQKKKSLSDLKNEYYETNGKRVIMGGEYQKLKKEYESRKSSYEFSKDPDIVKSLGLGEDMVKKLEENYLTAKKKFEEMDKEYQGLADKAKALEKEIKDEEERLKKEVTGFVRSPEVMATVKKNENKIRNQDYETATCVGMDGKEIFTKSDGHKSEVRIDDDKLPLLKNAVFTHNHPGGSTFSEEDVSVAVAYGLAEIRACHKNGAYSLVRQYDLDGEKPSGHDNFAWDYAEALRKYVTEVTRPIWEKEPHVQETADKLNKMVMDYRKKWLSENAEKYGWKYTEE